MSSTDRPQAPQPPERGAWPDPTSSRPRDLAGSATDGWPSVAEWREQRDRLRAATPLEDDTPAPHGRPAVTPPPVSGEADGGDDRGARRFGDGAGRTDEGLGWLGEGAGPVEGAGPAEGAGPVEGARSVEDGGGLFGGGAGGRSRRGGRKGTRRRGRLPDGPDDESPAGTGPQADPESVARNICLRLLTMAPKTRAQLAEALRKRDVPEEAAEAVLSRFSELGLINDEAFAAAWVDSRHHGRGLAKRALAAELRHRGVDSDTVNEAVERLDPDQEEETARRLVERKLAATRSLDPQTRTRRLAGMLARKGYPSGLAFRVIREALEQEGVEVEEDFS
ncbi:recombination regulator RecX [Nonomuraea rubra]|uniref:recombination regulator RecX n=1 Tax=Nonomuraea rubra TaxID=46180 RepID=UPI0016200A64|nr:recombination regulator RecX [Nonomuraea rubra]